MDHPMSASLRKLIDGAPARVTLVDVSARDGLQAFPRPLSPARRAEWIRRVLDAGIPEAEAGSFVRPDRVPQMAGTGEVLARLQDHADRLWVLAPNLKGLEEAAAAGARNVVCLASATERHSRANLGRSVDEVLRQLEAMAQRIRVLGLKARVSVSVVWGEPEEPASLETVLRICSHVRALGFSGVTLADTIGTAGPRAVVERIEAVAEVVPLPALGLHLHDATGTALVAAWAAWAAGVARFDASLGGLGGCPAVREPRGNLNLESLVRLFDICNVTTGVDPARLAAAGRENAALLADVGPGHAATP